jgi:predicted metal-dependent peptidase
MDVVINDLLLTSFGFNKEDIPAIYTMGAFFEKYFKDDEANREDTYEYYYSLLLKSAKTINISLSFDNHDGLPEISDKDLEKLLGKAVKKLSKDEKKELINSVKKHIEKAKEEAEKAKAESKQNKQKQLSYGLESVDGPWQKILSPKPPVKPKWQTIIRRWSHKAVADNDGDQWVRPNRRYTIVDKYSNVLLPSCHETEDKEINRIEVWLFLDTSGSCIHEAERFFTAAETLPQRHFKIRLFCFDTAVYETTLKSREVKGGGGTSFHVIERYIQNKMKADNLSYPKAVFLITDGCGDKVTPEFAERWMWMLTENGSNDGLPKKSTYYQLSDFE